MNSIRRRLDLVDIRQNIYRKEFKDLPIYSWDCKDVYKKLDKCNREVMDFESEIQNMAKQAELFELSVPEYKHITQTRKELKQLKQLWDYVLIARSCIDEWRATLWKKIDVENMEMECKKYGKELRAMDKDIKGWDVFIQMEASIRNMLTALRAVTELQNPAIRDRHWKQLMQATKVKRNSCIFRFRLLRIHHFNCSNVFFHKAPEEVFYKFCVSTNTD